jgi:hypothetical protein
MELCEASVEVVRRRLAENDGGVAFKVIRSIIPPVAKARQRKSVKAYLSRISPRHIRVINEYAAGKTWLKLRAKKNQAAELFCEF